MSSKVISTNFHFIKSLLFAVNGCLECVVYNSHVNTWERLIEPAGHGGNNVSLVVKKLDLSQTRENMEEITITTKGMFVP